MDKCRFCGKENELVEFPSLIKNPKHFTICLDCYKLVHEFNSFEKRHKIENKNEKIFENYIVDLSSSKGKTYNDFY